MEASLSGLLTALRAALDQAGYDDVLLSVELSAETVLHRPERGCRTGS
jgi:hypothetical protein